MIEDYKNISKLDRRKWYKDAVELANQASEAYYNSDQPIMSDQEFDRLISLIDKYETEYNIHQSSSPTLKVGAQVLSSIKRVEIPYQPMLSLEKVYSEEAIESFAKGQELIGSIKYDGVSTRLVYNHGELVAAYSRGDGYVGGDITEHVKQFTNVPLSIRKTKLYIVDGESIIYEKDFKEINKDNKFANPRNTVAGALNLLDMSEVKSRRISFVVWDIITGGAYNTYEENIREAFDYHLDVANIFKNDSNENIMQYAKDNGIPCDGVVWRINDLDECKNRPGTAHHPGYAIAWKPPAVSKPTTLTNIEWTMGRTGQITPVAIFQPVQFEDAKVSRASLHNLKIIKEILGETPFVGQPIKVEKKNMIIPQVVSSAFKEAPPEAEILKPPTTCPICNKPLVLVETDTSLVLQCVNDKCGGMTLKSIEHFVSDKGLDIKGLSTAKIQALHAAGYLDSIVDLYNLENFAKQIAQMPGFGVKSVGNLIEAINNSKKCNLAKFIAALGIPEIGAEAAKVLAAKFISWAEFIKAVKTDFNFYTLPNFGAMMHQYLLEFDYTEAEKLADNYLEIQDYQEKQSAEIQPLTGLTFVVTGTLKHFSNRKAIQADIESKGGRLSSSVSSRTSYLINNDITSNSSKNQTARTLGIPIISEEEYLSL